MERLSVLFLLLMLCMATTECRPRSPPNCDDSCEDWLIGVDSVEPSGVEVYGHANIPIHDSSVGKVHGTVHGSRVFGGPDNGAQTVGGEIRYQREDGLRGKVDVTHKLGVGNTVSATVGGSVEIGPGTLTVDGGARIVPSSGEVNGLLGVSYTVSV